MAGGGGYEACSVRKLDAESIGIPLFFGFLFGFGMVKSTAYLPSVIYKQLTWDSYLLCKFYLSALAASLIFASILSLAGAEAGRRFDQSRITMGPGIVAVSVGASLSGLGMALTGTEPAAAFLQAGTGVISGLYVLCGGLIAVVVYGLLYKDVFDPIEKMARPTRSSLDDVFKAKYWQVALPLGAIICLICYFLETKWAQPWTSEVPVSPDDSWTPKLNAPAWNVYYVGALVGILQIPLRATLFCLLDTTDAFISAITVIMRVLADSANFRIPDWFRSHGQDGRLWGLFFFGSAAGGGALAAYLGGMMSYEHGFGIKWCLLGGFFLVLGALICKNCPTGLVVSGSSDLNLQCMLGAIIVLISGMAAAHLLKGCDIHPERSKAFLIQF